MEASPQLPPYDYESFLIAVVAHDISAFTAQTVMNNVLEVYEDIEDYAAVVHTYNADSMEVSGSVFEHQQPSITFNLFFRIGAPGTKLPTPIVVQALDGRGKPIIGRSITFLVYEGGGSLSTTTTKTDANGEARTTLTLEPNQDTNKVAALEIGFKASFTATATIPEDVNGDETVNIQDLVLVSTHLGQTGESEADVNGDHIVDILDLAQVAGALQ